MRAGYRTLARQEPKRIKLIKVDGDKEEIYRVVKKYVDTLLDGSILNFSFASLFVPEIQTQKSGNLSDSSGSDNFAGLNMITSAIEINENVLKRFAVLEEKGLLAHAYLFVGPAHIGKAATALAVAKFLNCEDKKNRRDRIFATGARRA